MVDGAAVGRAVGGFVGDSVGDSQGDFVGDSVGDAVAAQVGCVGMTPLTHLTFPRLLHFHPGEAFQVQYS